MSVTVVGSIALDTVETPSGKTEEELGGAATYFALAASNYTRVHLVGVVGEDFPLGHVDLFKAKGIILDGLETVPGKTFRWAGKYHQDMNERDTLDTQLNVFEQFHPKLPEAAREAKFLFLGNIHPSLQLEVLEQTQAQFVALDTMNLWIHTAREDLDRAMRRVDAILINDAEVKDLTGEPNLVKGARAVAQLGPRIVIAKKGEHGCLLFEDEQFFATPAMPLENLVDPTGAGDTFGGGLMGYIAYKDATDPATLRQAIVHGTIIASFACQAFGPARLAQITMNDILQRYDAFRQLVTF